MSRYYEKDVRDAIKTKLDVEFNAMIDTIRAERSDITIPYANSITISELTYNYPEITIDIDGESEFVTEILEDNADIEGEIFPVRVNAVIMTYPNLITAYGDYYNEAFKRVLHGCSISGLTWCRVKKSKQVDMIDENMNTYKNCGVDLEVRIN